MKDLFRKWQNDINGEGEFHYDGIINPSLFEKSKIKLLFVTKEPNAENHKTEEDRDFTKWLTKNEDWIPFKKNIGNLAYGILNDFPDFNKADNNQNRIAALNNIAFINLKKTGGKGTTTKSFRQHILRPVIQENILHQIELIKPTHIILCLGELDGLSRKIFKDSQPIRQKELGMEIDLWNSKTLIHFYHPSGRVASPMMYYYLKELWNRSSQ